MNVGGAAVSGAASGAASSCDGAAVTSGASAAARTSSAASTSSGLAAAAAPNPGVTAAGNDGADTAEAGEGLPASQGRSREPAGRPANSAHRVVPEIAVPNIDMKTFLASAIHAAETISEGLVPDIEMDDDLISQEKRLYSLIRERYARWSPQIQTLGVAALSVYRLRLLDMSLREHVMLLQIVEGGCRLRAHDGVCYFYRNGAWQPFRGVMPEATLNRVKKFMLTLEGLFRSMQRNSPRTDSAVLDAIATLLTNHPDDLLQHLEWLSVSAPVERRRSRGPGAWGEGEEPDEHMDVAAEETTQGWPAVLSSALARTCSSLMRELIGGKIITHFIEWCETPSQKRAGFALEDCCFAFDPEDDPARRVAKSPTNDIYIFLPHSLCDPVENSAMQRLQTFWSTTFWCNDHALECNLAAMSLALRGRNVDRAFWSQGPGGVGQSLESHRVAALFGPLHGFLDLNIYYDDNELRKQSENLVGKLVTTGQEAEDGRGGMKQDLYKKHISADPVPSRLPYAIVTRLVELTGWKRFETNRVIHFSGVTEDTFHSIFRRSLVVEYQARFFSEQQILAKYTSLQHAAARGVFPRDPSLKDFLKSGSCVAASLRFLLGWMSDKTEAMCREVIENYAAHGGDGGLTEATMRAACGLKLPDPQQEVAELLASGQPSDNGPAPANVSDEIAGSAGPAAGSAAHPEQTQLQRQTSVRERIIQRQRDDLMKDHIALVDVCLKSGIDILSKHAVPRFREAISACHRQAGCTSVSSRHPYLLER